MDGDATTGFLTFFLLLVVLNTWLSVVLRLVGCGVGVNIGSGPFITAANDGASAPTRGNGHHLTYFIGRLLLLSCGGSISRSCKILVRGLSWTDNCELEENILPRCRS